jgi:hypothetical protein
VPGIDSGSERAAGPPGYVLPRQPQHKAHAVLNRSPLATVPPNKAQHPSRKLPSDLGWTPQGGIPMELHCRAPAASISRR